MFSVLFKTNHPIAIAIQKKSSASCGALYLPRLHLALILIPKKCNLSNLEPFILDDAQAGRRKNLFWVSPHSTGISESGAVQSETIPNASFKSKILVFTQSQSTKDEKFQNLQFNEKSISHPKILLELKIFSFLSKAIQIVSEACSGIPSTWFTVLNSGSSLCS